MNKLLLLHIFCVLCCAAWAQTRSNNIQTIDGKRFYIHRIEKSQSLYGISKLYNVSIEELYSLNPDLKAGAKASQEIKIPFNGPAPAVSSATVAPIDTAKYLTYKITKGETLYSITKKFNLSEKQLSSYNPSLAQGLREGQLIIVGEKTKRKSAPAKETNKSAPKETKESRPVMSTVKEKPAPTPIDSSAFKPVIKPAKSSYNVALILPFKLDHVLALDVNELAHSNSPFPVVPGLAIDFYLGFKRVVDSLSAKDFEVHLELYDIDDKDSLKIVQLINDPKFKDLDLIFGPLYASGFKPISKKAKELHIPIVSPIMQQNKIVYNNIYVSKTNPSQFTLLESLADYCIDSLMSGNAHIMLMASSDKKEQAFITAFKKYFNDRQKQLGRPAKDTVAVVKGIGGIKASFVAGVKNIIVSFNTNQVFVADFTTQLAMFADRKDIVLCGWESVSNMDNIDQEYLNQLNYTFPYQFNLTNTTSYGSVIDSYRAQQDCSPGEYYFLGFDIAYYYLKNLKELGPGFVFNLNTLPAETNYMRFKFTRPDNLTGFDNRGAYIFRYNNYQLQKTGWK